jgi:hypothetical protein
VNSTCPYCRELIAGPDHQACPGCHTPHHPACWQENRGCTVFGCQYAPPDEPKMSVSSPVVHSTSHSLGQGPNLGGRFLVSRNGQQLGPYTLDELRRYYGQGRIADTDHAWCDGMPQWVPLTHLLRIAPSPVTPPRIPLDHAYRSQNRVEQTIVQHVIVKPDSYMLSAVLVTLLCCLPFGIVSIVFASQVDTKFNAGDYAGAQDSSNKAKNWYHAALIAGILILIGSILVNVADTSR